MIRYVTVVQSLLAAALLAQAFRVKEMSGELAGWCMVLAAVMGTTLFLVTMFREQRP